MPLGYDLTLTETLMPHAGPAMPAIGLGDWEVGRLALAPDFRTDVDALRQCLRMSLGFAFEHAQVDHLFATCTHVLSRLYRRFGFSEVAREVPLPGTSKAYTLIRGSAPAIAAGLSSRGGAQ